MSISIVEHFYYYTIFHRLLYVCFVDTVVVVFPFQDFWPFLVIVLYDTASDYPIGIFKLLNGTFPQYRSHLRNVSDKITLKKNIVVSEKEGFLAFFPIWRYIKRCPVVAAILDFWSTCSQASPVQYIKGNQGIGKVCIHEQVLYGLYRGSNYMHYFAKCGK